MGLRRYRELLRIPGLPQLMAAAFLGRLPFGMSVLSLILLLRAHHFDYGWVGVITAAAGFSVGVSAPILGRVVDRVGQTTPLVVMSALTVVTGAVLVAAVAAGAGPVVATVLAFVAGASVPPLSASLRTLIPTLVGPDRVDTAFALDALLLELVFIVGPLLAATLAAAISPEVGYLTAVGLQAGGALWLAARPESRRWRPAPRDPGVAHRGALSTAGIRTMVVSLGVTAVALGVLEIGIAAFAEEHATRDDAGWLFALWSVGSFAGGLWYGGHRWQWPPHMRFLAVTGVLVAGLAPVPLAGSMPVFGALLILAGLGLAPSTASAYSLIGALAPDGATTEAYSWQIVGYVVGSAAGAWLAGAMVEAGGVGAALACAPLAAAIGLLVALGGRRSITV
jgi:MFS family permease